jgi:hypothetical protein
MKYLNIISRLHNLIYSRAFIGFSMSQETQAASSGTMIEVVVFFLSDGVVTLYGEHDPHGRVYECGDLLQFRRDRQSPLEAAIVLGSGSKCSSLLISL